MDKRPGESESKSSSSFIATSGRGDQKMKHRKSFRPPAVKLPLSPTSPVGLATSRKLQAFFGAEIELQDQDLFPQPPSRSTLGVLSLQASPLIHSTSPSSSSGGTFSSTSSNTTLSNSPSSNIQMVDSYPCQRDHLKANKILQATFGKYASKGGLSFSRGKDWKKRDFILTSNARATLDVKSQNKKTDVEVSFNGSNPSVCLHVFKSDGNLELERLTLNLLSYAAVSNLPKNGGGKWILKLSGVVDEKKLETSMEWLLGFNTMTEMMIWQNTLRSHITAIVRAEQVFRNGKKPKVTGATNPPRKGLSGLFGPETDLSPPPRSRSTAALISSEKKGLRIDLKPSREVQIPNSRVSVSSNGAYVEELSPVTESILCSSSSFGFRASTFFSPGPGDSGSNGSSIRTPVDSDIGESLVEWAPTSDDGHQRFRSQSNASTSSLPLEFSTRSSFLPPRTPAPKVDLPSPPNWQPKRKSSLSALKSSVPAVSLPSLPSPGIKRHQPRSEVVRESPKSDWSQISHPYGKLARPEDRLSMNDVISTSFQSSSPSTRQAQPTSHNRSLPSGPSLDPESREKPGNQEVGQMVDSTKAADPGRDIRGALDQAIVSFAQNRGKFEGPDLDLVTSLSSPTSELDSSTDPLSPPFKFDSVNLYPFGDEAGSSESHGTKVDDGDEEKDEARTRQSFFNGSWSPSSQLCSSEDSHGTHLGPEHSALVPLYLSSRRSSLFNLHSTSLSFSSSSSASPTSKGVLPYSKRTSFGSGSPSTSQSTTGSKHGSDVNPSLASLPASTSNLNSRSGSATIAYVRNASDCQQPRRAPDSTSLNFNHPLLNFSLQREPLSTPDVDSEAQVLVGFGDEEGFGFAL